MINEVIDSIIVQIYGERSSGMIEALSDLRERYDLSGEDSGQLVMDERYLALITYGDSITAKSGSHLASFNSFYRDFCAFFSIVHVLPFYPYSSDWGFSIKDYKKVDAQLGTAADIRQLSKQVDLMFDFVLNHTSVEHSWFERFLADDPEFKDFYISVNPEADLSSVVRPRSHPLLTEFDSVSGPKWIWTTFSADQADLNYANPEVLLRMIDVMLFYVSKGAKILRLDAIAYLWKEIGTPCIHHPKTHAIVKLLRAILDEIAPGTVLLTETNVPNIENISYFGAPGSPEAQMVYQFPLPPLIAYSILKQDASCMTGWARSLEKPWGKNTFFNFAASHDGIGVRPLEGLVPAGGIGFMVDKCLEHGGQVSTKENTDGSRSPYELNINYLDLLAEPDDSDDVAIDKFVLSQAIMVAMPGLPAFYFHSLVGSRNDYEGVKRTGENRAINREKLDYEHLVTELGDPNSFRHRVYSRLAELIEIRKRQPAFSPYADFDFPALSDQVFAIYRQAQDGQKLLALHNVSGQEDELELAAYGEQARELLTGLVVDLSGSFRLEPYHIYWLEIIK